MHPALVELGPISIRFYGLMYVIGIVLAMVMLRREAKRKDLPLTEGEVENFILLLVLGGIFGARLYYVAFNWDYYGANLSQIPALWRGGLAIHGGLIGGLLAGLWFARRHQIPLWRLGDTIAPNLILGQALGRLRQFHERRCPRRAHRPAVGHGVCAGDPGTRAVWRHSPASGDAV